MKTLNCSISAVSWSEVMIIDDVKLSMLPIRMEFKINRVVFSLRETKSVQNSKEFKITRTDIHVAASE